MTGQHVDDVLSRFAFMAGQLLSNGYSKTQAICLE